MSTQTELKRLQESADFWHDRANNFELALRKIIDVRETDSGEVASERWEIAKRALDAGKDAAP